MTSIRHDQEQFTAIALKPSLLHALWDRMRDGGTASITLQRIDGTITNISEPRELAAECARQASAIQQIAIEGKSPNGATRRAEFTAGSAFIRNEVTLTGPHNFVQAGRKLLSGGLVAGAAHYPDLFTTAYAGLLVGFASTVIFSRLAGLRALPPIMNYAIGIIPLLILLRVWRPPAIRTAADDAAFEAAATAERRRLHVTLVTAKVVPAIGVWFYAQP